MDPVSSAESLFAGVCQQALGFCSDKDGDGVIELGEGCLIVSVMELTAAAAGFSMCVSWGFRFLQRQGRR
jgi:hypothetical protein